VADIQELAVHCASCYYRAEIAKDRAEFVLLLHLRPMIRLSNAAKRASGVIPMGRIGHGSEDNRRGPHGGAVDAADRDDFVDDENEKQDAEAGDGSSGGRKSDAAQESAEGAATRLEWRSGSDACARRACAGRARKRR